MKPKHLFFCIIKNDGIKEVPNMAYQPEAELEKNLQKQLVNQGFKAVKIADYDALLANLKQQLNLFNERKLNGQPLSDIEFKRILTLIEGKSIYDSAKILRDKLLIEREDGTQLYVELLNTKDWCKNLFQVTTQTTV